MTGELKIPKNSRVLAVTCGDHQGIGPEVVGRALERFCHPGPLLLLGCPEDMLSADVISEKDLPGIVGRGVFHLAARPEQFSAAPSFNSFVQGVSLARAGLIDGLVTGPVAKKRWLDAGVPYLGHSDYLARGCGFDLIMSFWAADLKTVLFTAHIPLKDIWRHLQKDKIVDFIKKTDRELNRLFNKSFTFICPGLNPHSGENGALGLEEQEIIGPALQALPENITVLGPFPPDTAFLQAQKQKDAVVLAWYHDQALLPFKMINFSRGVQLTLGLPFVRTSPDHGTAEAIRGLGLADPGSTLAAMQLASDLLVRPDQGPTLLEELPTERKSTS